MDEDENYGHRQSLYFGLRENIKLGYEKIHNFGHIFRLGDIFGHADERSRISDPVRRDLVHAFLSIKYMINPSNLCMIIVIFAYFW